MQQVEESQLASSTTTTTSTKATHTSECTSATTGAAKSAGGAGDASQAYGVHSGEPAVGSMLMPVSVWAAVFDASVSRQACAVAHCCRFWRMGGGPQA